MIPTIPLPHNSILITILLVSLGLVILVGPKATPKGVTLKRKVFLNLPMLAFELDAGSAQYLFSSWDDVTKRKFKKALIWDYIFIPSYLTAIASACFLAANLLDKRGIWHFYVSLLFICICLQIIAAILDAIENYALLKVLDGSLVDTWPFIAKWCALIKFSLIGLGILYILLGIAGWLFLLIKSILIKLM